MKQFAIAIALLVGLQGLAAAESRIETPSGYTTIADGDISRCLIRVGVPGNLGSVAVSRAEIAFDWAGSAREGILRLALHPITSAWDPASVTWTEGWRTPGGDFDPELIARAEVDLSQPSGTGRVDVTSILKDVVESGDEFFGLLVTVESGFGRGIPSVDVDRFSGLANARLEWSHRRIPPPPRLDRVE